MLHFCRLSLLSFVLLVVAWFPGRAAHGTPVFGTSLTARQVTGGYTPGRIQMAYGFTPLYRQNVNGTGQTVALLELNRFLPADVGQFDARYRLPAPAIAESYVGGQPFPLGDGSESSFDIEWLHALAPGAAIQVYYLDRSLPLVPGWQQMALGIESAVANGASIISISLGTCWLDSSSQVAVQALHDAMQRGVSIFVSSGDDGDHPGPLSTCGFRHGVSYPGSDPSVVSVGGTSLQLKRNNTIYREVAWSLSGGGRVKRLQRFSWQTAPTMPHDGYRWAPDVAFLGDPKTGVNFVRNGKWLEAGGTSLGAPAWSAAWAMIRQYAESAGKPVAPAQQMIYRIGNSPVYRAGFHDITVGSNGQYHAGPGWDPVTGWGTPNVSVLAQIVRNWTTSSH